MNGHIASAVAIVCAGNRYLAGQDIEGFWPDAPVFNFTKLVEFRHAPASGKGTDDHPLVASDPMEWFETLKPRCRGLRLHHVVPVRGPDQQIDVPDRMLAGFVGGGARWLIEAAGSEQSEIWEPFHRLGDRSDPQRRIWKCTHIMLAKAPRHELDPDMAPLDKAVAALRKALVHIETYARDEEQESFADIFNEAVDTIDAGKPSIEQGDMARFTGFDDRHAAIFEACSRAWVFGGMGSWNDIGGSGERYDRVSQALYDTLNACVAALANSTFRG